MTCLDVQGFSCLDSISLELSPITIIIGEQGSGKSVITKLQYFLSSIPFEIPRCAQRGMKIDDYTKALSVRFSQWFPPPAWGGNRFNITLTAGKFSIRVLRRMKAGALSDEISIKFSDWFIRTYEWSLGLFERSEDISDAAEDDVLGGINRSYEIREKILDRIRTDLAGDLCPRQNFVPAGRAFFTSIGKIVAGIEAAGNLDPITTDFAREFAAVRDIRMNRPRPLYSRLSSVEKGQLEAYMAQLFGGHVESDQDSELLKTLDGRMVPFSAMSSGQQEMIPIWFMLELILAQDEASRRFSNIKDAGFSRLVYIEEPEAHLFPKAQGRLIDLLIGVLAAERSGRHLVITTHSPYILSKINLFLQAGKVARRRGKRSDVYSIVPQGCALPRERVGVISVSQGQIQSIIDPEVGLIDGDYLDSLSEEIDEQFGRLLELEG